MQVLGGAGHLRGHPVERIYREVKVMAIGGGSEEIMRYDRWAYKTISPSKLCPYTRSRTLIDAAYSTLSSHPEETSPKDKLAHHKTYVPWKALDWADRIKPCLKSARPLFITATIIFYS